MKLEEARAILKAHNEWRRGGNVDMQDHKSIGHAIDCLLAADAAISNAQGEPTLKPH